MKLRTLFFALSVLLVIFFACSPDDPDFIPVEDRDRTEQQVADNDSIVNYLQAYYYNKTELASISNPSPSDIKLKTFSGTPDEGYSLLFADDNLLTRTTTFEDTEYTYYILKINQGGGDESPEFTDRVRVEYEGSLVTDASVFDSAVTPTDFNLVGFGVGTGVITGWQRVFTEFNVAASFTTGANVEYDNYGLGVMFLPSGLAYFSSQLVGIPSYSNLIFKFSLFQTEENDHDGDGIPSFIEDLNSDLSVFDEDTDEDNIVNYVDPDDDGDGVSTRNELKPMTYTINVGDPDPPFGNNEYVVSRSEEGSVITIETLIAEDSNNNGTLDYLEEEVAIDNSGEDE